MCASMLIRAEAWNAILRAALPGTTVRRRDTARATMVGVLMSATLPARLGEPSRAFIVARRLGRMRERFPLVLGTLVSQTVLNLLALVILGVVMFATVGLFRGNEDALLAVTLGPVVVLLLLLAVPALLRRGRPSRSQRVQQWVASARRVMVRMRTGLQVFRRPKLGAWAATAQLTAWAVQWMSCYLLLVALGLDAQAGIGAAAAVLFAVNVTAALPATPSNLGVFQAACVGVLDRLRRQPRRGAGLRDHPPGGGDRHRAGHGHARPVGRGADVARPAHPGAALHAGPAGDLAPLGQAPAGQALQLADGFVDRAGETPSRRPLLPPPRGKPERR